MHTYIQVITGKYVTEVRQKFSPGCNDSIDLISCGVEQTYRLIHSSDAAVASTVLTLTSVGPLELNKDFVSRYTTSLQTNGVFYTDDNCFEVHQRTFSTNMSANVIGGNYYPMTCAGFIKDDVADVQLTFLNDRTRGATSQANGQFEIMMRMCNSRVIVDSFLCFVDSFL